MVNKGQYLYHGFQEHKAHYSEEEETHLDHHLRTPHSLMRPIVIIPLPFWLKVYHLPKQMLVYSETTPKK